MLCSGLLLWAQNQPFPGGPGPGGPGGVGGPGGPPPGFFEFMGAILAFYACIFFVSFLMTVVVMAGTWKAYAKAGEPGWAAIVPVYNIMIMARIAGKDEVQALLTLIPVVGIVFYIMILIDFCKCFDVSPAYVIGLILLPYVFWPMLGFGSAGYLGPSLGSRPGRGRDPEDEDDRPRRRRRDEDEDDRDRPRRDDNRVQRRRDREDDY